MKKYVCAVLIVLFCGQLALGAGFPISDNTEACLECHRTLDPGIVADWELSRMAKITPQAARGMIQKKRRVSFDKIPQKLADVGVGCAECHTMNSEKHGDTFEHNGYQIHVVVSPEDCAVCHPVEREQYSKNLMSHAYGNLQNNPVFRDLVNSVNGMQSFKDMETTYDAPDQATDADSCFYCHGTVVKLIEMMGRDTEYGSMSFPVLSGWPNQGVGRVNPDGSKGTCTACHTRHQFSIEMARRPHTCSECHKGPDVPAYKVYVASKHGNVYAALGKDKTWDFNAVPWIVGDDFSAPTCATCHVSLLVSRDGQVIAERTHQMSDRIAWRIMGLVYAHPRLKSPDTTIVRNEAGLPLPTELTGEPVTKYVIDAKEQKKRRNTMKLVCFACHSQGWVDGQFARFENTIKTTNKMTLTATEILLSAWEKGAASGLAQKDSTFNEAIEKKWVEQWLFYANSTRYASAMVGADYGVFANGRWFLSKNIQDMADWLEFKLKSLKERTAEPD
jgi:hydroxylamine dehydrogenase